MLLLLLLFLLLVLVLLLPLPAALCVGRSRAGSHCCFQGPYGSDPCGAGAPRYKPYPWSTLWAYRNRPTVIIRRVTIRGHSM